MTEARPLDCPVLVPVLKTLAKALVVLGPVEERPVVVVAEAPAAAVVCGPHVLLPEEAGPSAWLPTW